jgi:2,4-dienoyl-CoA reductase-like NADH-dependent reductase (Old Yellow Enzyme family)
LTPIDRWLEIVDLELNEWHQAHYAMLARGGAAVVVVEATFDELRAKS